MLSVHNVEGSRTSLLPRHASDNGYFVVTTPVGSLPVYREDVRLYVTSENHKEVKKVVDAINRHKDLGLFSRIENKKLIIEVLE